MCVAWVTSWVACKAMWWAHLLVSTALQVLRLRVRLSTPFVRAQARHVLDRPSKRMAGAPRDPQTSLQVHCNLTTPHCTLQCRFRPGRLQESDATVNQFSDCETLYLRKGRHVSDCSFAWEDGGNVGWPAMAAQPNHAARQRPREVDCGESF